MATKAKVVSISGEDAPKKKKKKKLPTKVTKEQALVIATKPEKKRISKLNTKGMRSIIGDSAEEIQQLLESNNNESASTLMQKRLLQGLVDLLPYAEHAVRKSKGARGVYQINSLITSVRELMIDLQATRDKGAIGDTMVEKIIRPAFLDIGMDLVLEDEKMLTAIKDEVDLATYKAIKQIHQDSLRRLAATIQGKYAEAKQQAITFLQQ
jgi:hypothetical protein